MKPIHNILVCIAILLYAGISLANVQQGNWRWRNDNGDVYNATWKDSLNTPVVLTEYENIRLRIETTFRDPDTSNISLRYTDDIFSAINGNNSAWIPVTGIDTGNFYISPSLFLSDTTSYFNNQLLPMRDTFFTYRKTIAFDYTDNYFLIGDTISLYELEYSIKPTFKIQPGSAYFFSLFDDSLSMFGKGNEYAILMTPPVNWITQSFESEYSYCYLNDVFFTDENTGTTVGNGWNEVNSGGVILRTIDGGITWIQQSCPTEAYNLNAVCFINADIGTAVGDNGIIIRTTNGGEEWAKQMSGTEYSLRDVCFTNADTGTAVGVYCDNTSCSSIILRTTNGGMTWTKQSYPNKILYAVCFTNADIGTIVGGNGTILRTTNGGESWITQSSGITGPLNSVSFTDANTGTAVGYENGGIILRTTNGGITWWKSFEFPGPDLNSVHFINNNTGWAVGEYGLILKTTDGGLNWKKLVSGTSRALRAVHFIDNEIGWVVGDMGKILKTTNGGITTFVDEKESKYFPDNFYLSQNYPNPFNPSTVISYQLAVSSQVTLKVYDVLGNEVATLVNEEKPAGSYEVEFNASNLASGIYFYQLRTGEIILTKKMVIIR